MNLALTILLASTIWLSAQPPLPGSGVPLPAIILSQPSAVLVAEGGSASFSIVITGAPPLRCQWRKDGTELNGKTNTVLIIRNAAGSDAGDYLAVVTNSFSGATSAPARLRLKVAARDSEGLVYTNEASGLHRDWWVEGYGWQNNTAFIPHDGSHTVFGSNSTVRLDWDTTKTNAEFIIDWTDAKTNLWYPFHVLAWTSSVPGRVTWVYTKWRTNRPGYFRVHEKLPGDMFTMVYPP